MKPLGTSPSPGRLQLALLLIVLLIHRTHLLAADNLTAGAALRPPGYITCPSGDFAFGFRALDHEPSQFLLAVWFNLDLGKTSGDPALKKVVCHTKHGISSLVSIFLLKQVADQLLFIHEQCLQSNYSPIEKLKNSHVQENDVSQRRQILADDNDDDNVTSNDDDHTSTTDDEAAAAEETAVDSNPSPDADGWTVVPPRRHGRMS
ncbi:hypothetical protein BRADI_1g35850v3 [Brachypodium distachyon]|uniref:Uncharacterized protein n=1 Tax=Brachypodium distachyon TaxID=15368 RepID=I1GX89_BRADI|nr:hypothetical protein BRADI_1g35850v3 [Brachypodium distachyon]